MWNGENQVGKWRVHCGRRERFNKNASLADAGQDNAGEYSPKYSLILSANSCGQAQGGKARRPGRGSWDAGQPCSHPHRIDCSGDSGLLERRFCEPNGAGPPESNGSNPLRNRAFNSCTHLGPSSPRRGLFLFPSLEQRFVLLPGMQHDMAGRAFRACTQRPNDTGRTVGTAELQLDDPVPKGVLSRTPCCRGVALRAGRLLPLPVDPEIGEIIALTGLGLSTAVDPEWANQGDLLVLTGHEQFSIGLSGIHQMLLGTQVFLDELVPNGVRTGDIRDFGVTGIAVDDQVNIVLVASFGVVHFGAQPFDAALVAEMGFRVRRGMHALTGRQPFPRLFPTASGRLPIKVVLPHPPKELYRRDVPTGFVSTLQCHGPDLRPAGKNRPDPPE